MITYKQGDLFEEIGHVDVIVNTVNMEGVMGKGIALQFKKRFPQMFKTYKHTCQSHGIDFERPHLFCTPNVHIINLVTKDKWRNKSNLTDVTTSLKALRKKIEFHRYKRVAMPPPGCGNGGLDWVAVNYHIQRIFKDCDFELIVYTPYPVKRNLHVAVVGSRGFDNMDLLSNVLSKFCAPFSKLTVVSGTAKGADTMGEEYARAIGYDVFRIPAPWNDLGNKAGMIRNIEMAHYADVIIAFWDGKSPGTKQMIDYAGRLGKLAAVIQY